MESLVAWGQGVTLNKNISGGTDGRTADGERSVKSAVGFRLPVSLIAFPTRRISTQITSRPLTLCCLDCFLLVQACPDV